MELKELFDRLDGIVDWDAVHVYLTRAGWVSVRLYRDHERRPDSCTSSGMQDSIEDALEVIGRKLKPVEESP